MNSLLEIIKLIKKKVICPVCKESYGTGEVKVKFLSNKEVVVSTICPNGHIAIFTAKNEKSVESDLENIGITTEEVNNLSKELKSFDGDFENKWK